MKLEVAETGAEMSRRAGEMISRALKERPDLILCASAGDTPTGMYQCLAAKYTLDPQLFSRMRVLQIDEWGGLPRDSAGTCAADLKEKLAGPLTIPPDRFVGFQTDAPNPRAECERISRWLAANGPIDVCILGLGLNGHIAMNEPAEALTPDSHVAQLAPSSQQHGMLKHLKARPTYGFTLGMGDIISSRLILLLVSGERKRGVLKKLLEPRISPGFPASFLWLHANTTVLCDSAAVPDC